MIRDRVSLALKDGGRDISRPFVARGNSSDIIVTYGLGWRAWGGDLLRMAAGRFVFVF